MTFRRRTLLWTIGSFTLLVVISGMAVTSIAQMHAASQNVEQSHLVLHKLLNVFALLEQAETGQRGFLLTGREEDLQPFTTARVELVEKLGKLRLLTAAEGEQQADLNRLEELVNRRLEKSDEFIAIRHDHSLEETVPLLLSGDGRMRMDEIRAVIARMERREHDHLKERTATARKTRNRMLTVTVGGLLAGFLLLFAGNALLVRSVADPVRRLASVAERYGSGELGYRCAVTSDDEIGHLTRTFNVMAEKREAVEKRLHETSTTLEALIAASPLAIVGVDDHGNVTIWNPAAEALFGWHRDEVKGKPLPYIPADRSEEAERVHHQVRSGLVVTGLETTRLRRDGVPIDVNLSIARLNRNGESKWLVGLVEDISRRKELEKERLELLEFQQRLSWTLEAIAHASIAIADGTVAGATRFEDVLQIIVDRARAVTHADYAAIGMSTDSEEPFNPWVTSGTPPPGTWRTNNVPRPRGLLGWVARQGQVTRVKDMRHHPSFAEFDPNYPAGIAFLGVPIRYEGRSVGNIFLTNGPEHGAFSEQDQQAIELLAAHAGVAIENSRLYRAVLQERSRLRILSDASAALVGALDYGTVLKAVVGAAVPGLAQLCSLHLLNEEKGILEQGAVAFAREEWRDAARTLFRGGSIPLDALHPAAKAVQERRSLLLKEIPEEIREYIAPTPEDRAMLDALPINSAMSIYLSARGKPIGTLTFTCGKPHAFDEDDLTLGEELGRRVAIAIENARLYRSAQEAIRAREDVLAMVSHDLRSPLTTIDTTVALLQRASSDEKVQAKAEKIKQQVDRMSTLVSDLLDAAALEAGRLAIHRERHDVASCLSEMVESFKPVAERHHIRLEVVPPDPLPPIACDRVRLGQVFSNIIGNALKFTPREGFIRICAKGTLNEVEFMIRDSGPGISPEEAPHIFDRYRQAKGTLERGTGLGLFIVKGIIDAHGGRVWVESEPGKGSTFHFTLPVWREPR